MNSEAVLLKNADKWFVANQLSSAKWDAAIAEARANDVKRIFNEGRKAMQKQNIPEDQYPPKLIDFTPEQFGMERLARKGLQRLSWELERYKPLR